MLKNKMVEAARIALASKVAERQVSTSLAWNFLSHLLGPLKSAQTANRVRDCVLTGAIIR